MVLNGEIVKMDGISYNEVDDFVNEIISISSGMDESLLKKMEAYAYEHHVPIMDRVASNFISVLLKIYTPKRILELGTGIGYSAIFMCNQCLSIEILTSYEINIERYEIAKMYCSESVYGKKINLIQKDVRDFIYVDAAKGQYHKILDFYWDQLAPNGIMLFDNIFINGWVINLDYPNHRRKHYVLKMRKFLYLLKEQKHFDFSILPVSDGMLLIRKKD